MTISTFSSFLEFLAAVYSSMYFDRFFDFWSPKYMNNLDEALEKNNWTKDSLFSNNLKRACGTWYDRVRKAMLNRAAFMILSIVAILIFVGFEDCLNESQQVVAHASLVLTWTLTLVAVLFVFKRYFFSKVKRMFLALLFEFTVFFISFYQIVPDSPCLQELANHTSIALLLFTLLPVSLQMFTSWLSSAPYAEYLKKRLPSFKKEYDNAQKCLKTRDISLVNEEFKAVIAEMFVQGENSSDTSMDKYQELLQKKMLDTCQPNSIIVVFWSWIVFQKKHVYRIIFNKETIEDKNEIVYEMPVEFRIAKKSNVDYAEDYKKYIAEKKATRSLNIRTYCKNHNIPANEMINWVKANHPAK